MSCPPVFVLSMLPRWRSVQSLTFLQRTGTLSRLTKLPPVLPGPVHRGTQRTVADDTQTRAVASPARLALLVRGHALPMLGTGAGSPSKTQQMLPGWLFWQEIFIH